MLVILVPEIDQQSQHSEIVLQFIYIQGLK